jgi:Holliday junction resolvase RusA-like endonuclease
LLTETKNDVKHNLFSEQALQEHKNKVIRAKQDGNTDEIVEVLLSLRVNALQISPEQRGNLISELVKADIFLIQ